VQKFLEKGAERVSPFFIPMVITNLAAGQVSIRFNLKGPNYSITSACATGAHSIGEAYRYIKYGHADAMVAGGTESTICPMAVAGFSAMRALSTRNDSPAEASRPFDKDRDGFVLSEGCGVVILERLDHALERGAPILAEVVGYGATSDAYHITSPAPEGAGGARAMSLALQEAKIRADQVGYINAHGTSTPTGDVLEVQGIKTVFGDAAKKLSVSSTKSMIGHALGAAGAIESIFCILSLKDQVLPPTINLKNPDEGCDLDFVPLQSRSATINYALNNSFGFGGTNASLLFKRFQL
jgi:3-oxoacyl-[acyl-carrier-protein] synthase II